MRLIASDLALRVVIALRQSTRASLTELSSALCVRASSCQRALEVLLADQLVGVIGKGRVRAYVLEEENQALAAVEQLALTLVPPKEALVLVGNANPAVEFVGLTLTQVITVFAKRSATADRSQARETITRLSDALRLEPQFIDHQDLREARDRTIELRDVLSRGEVLVGRSIGRFLTGARIEKPLVVRWGISVLLYICPPRGRFSQLKSGTAFGGSRYSALRCAATSAPTAMWILQ